eukprot:4123239-Prymnesium_polylepis.3
MWSSRSHHHMVITRSSRGQHAVITRSSRGHHAVITWSSPASECLAPLLCRRLTRRSGRLMRAA